MERLAPVPFYKLADRQRTPARNWQLGLVLALVAGYINAGGFFLVGRYTSHMTGILSEAADSFALGLVLPAFALLGVIACFITGAAFTTILVFQGRRLGLRSQYALPLLAEAGLLSVIVACGRVLPQDETYVSLVIAVLCFLMGLQNALITKASTAVVRTTHVTGLTTDLGIEIGRWISGESGKADLIKMALFATVFLAFLIGGFVGAVLIRNWSSIGLVPVILVLLSVAIAPVLDDIRRCGDRAG